VVEAGAAGAAVPGDLQIVAAVEAARAPQEGEAVAAKAAGEADGGDYDHGCRDDASEAAEQLPSSGAGSKSHERHQVMTRSE